MRNVSSSQQLPPQTYSQQLQPQPQLYTTQPDDTNEGGLNVSWLLGAIRRRILTILIGTTAVASVSVLLAATGTPTYVAKFELLTEPVTAEDKVVSSKEEEKEEKDSPGLDETTLKVLQSPKLMSPITQKLQLYYPGSSTPQLNIKLLPNTNILEVSYKDPNFEKVQFVLDTVAEAYLKYSLEERQTDVNLGIQFVESQLPQLQRQVEFLQQRLQGFRQRHGIVNSDTQGQHLSYQLDRIEQKRLEIQTQLSSSTAFYNNLYEKLRLQPDTAAAITELSESPHYLKLFNLLQDVETKIAAKSSRYKEDSPEFQSLLAQQQQLLQAVRKEERRILGDRLPNGTTDLIDTASPGSARLREIQKLTNAAKQIQSLKAQDYTLNKSENLLRQQAKQFPIIIRQKDDLERQLRIASDNLNHFLTKREALRIDAAQKQVPWQILTPPSEPQNTAPTVQRNLVLGTALGLLVSFGVALLVDKLNNVFYNSEEIKDKTKLLILGEIPSVKFDRNSRLAQKTEVSDFWESFRSLYTNVSFLDFNGTVRSLAIVSAAPEDGKSTVALYLAQTAAAMGKRVLLVDANLRTPTIHKMLNLSNAQGLSNAIAEGLNFQYAIQQVRNSSEEAEDNGAFHEATAHSREISKDNLFILTAGSIPPNPSILLSSPQMQSLAEQLQQTFDLVIYDTSHLIGFADANLLARHVDASILTVSMGKTNCSALVKALEQLNFSATPVLGAVASGIQRQPNKLSFLSKRKYGARLFALDRA
ncbi:GumC family protein [Chroococcidiopsis thermalis]|uniref:Capsular exopolysaccharide family n=1 Tax=Chroococcidiopsis thermalis (strain PCC 7203) TaxID=251229 RepID=K9TW18_CHRTP|nr:tyrosine-protein kinase domain-containing protein [Chroococcidiopsis thermalis]AFY86356.1 capsular exopolysaccharide family [Chroococcidiopsis thermalis PCC 7203]